MVSNGRRYNFNSDNGVNLAGFGASEAVVKTSQYIGTVDAGVAERTCGAIWTRAINADNNVKFVKIGGSAGNKRQRV